jgi:hypothetical protein
MIPFGPINERPLPLPLRPPSHAGRRRATTGVTLVEIMVALTLLATVMLGFISTFLYSRRITEGSVLNAAASSLIYGIIEQMKGVSYTELLPSTAPDPDAPIDVRDKPPYIRVRINQDLTRWVRVVYTKKGNTPKAPTTVPDVTVKADDIGAIDNKLDDLPLSTVTGTTSQDLSINLWVWIDEIPDTKNDVSDVKKVTIVYTYIFMDGGRQKIVRNREVFLRTNYEQ